MANRFPRTLKKVCAGSSAPPSRASCPRNFRLGGLYEKGQGVKKDLNRRAALHRRRRKGPRQGHAQSRGAVCRRHRRQAGLQDRGAMVPQGGRATASPTASTISASSMPAASASSRTCRILQMVRAGRRAGRPGRRQEARRGRRAARPADARRGQARGADLHGRSAQPEEATTVQDPARRLGPRPPPQSRAGQPKPRAGIVRDACSACVNVDTRECAALSVTFSCD